MYRAIVTAALTLLLMAGGAMAQYSDWSAPANLGPVVNMDKINDTCAAVSKNGLSLYFSSNRPGTLGSLDLYVSKRARVQDPWGAPQQLPAVNTSSQESCPALSLDEHRLYFASNRPGGIGGLDLYVSRRQDRTDDFGWEAPVNLGSAVNSTASDAGPNLFEDETGTVILYFNSYRTGNWDLYMSRMREDDTFEAASSIIELNTSGYESQAAVRRDGLEVIFVSDRSGGLGGNDLWSATRASTADPWSNIVNLTVLNSSSSDGGHLGLSFDGRTLYFASNRTRPGGLTDNDLYVTTREKLRQ